MGGFSHPPVEKEKKSLQNPHGHLTIATIAPCVIGDRSNLQLLHFRFRVYIEIIIPLRSI